MSRNGQAAAVLAVLNARLGAMTTPRQAFELDDAPKTGGNFVAITLSRRYVPSPRPGGPPLITGWRLTTRAVGTVTNAGALLDICTQALEGKTVTVDGVTSTEIQLEAEDPIRQDDTDANLWSGLRSWTYAF